MKTLFLIMILVSGICLAKDKIELRTNPKNNKTWDRLIQSVNSSGNIKDLNTILDAKKEKTGIHAAHYIMDLYKILKVKPVLLIEHSFSRFKSHYCLIYWLIPETQFIHYKEFKSDITNAIENNPKKAKYLKEFEALGKKYFDRLKKHDEIKEVNSCPNIS